LKVLLNQDIDRVGRMGEVVEVAGGYARNFLIPRGMAVGVTRGRMKEIEEQKKVLEVKAARQREQVEELAEKVRSKRIVIKARCSATGKLFGSITNRQVAQEIAEQTGEAVDRHKIIIDDRIRSVGTYQAVIKLHPDVELELEFEVEGEGFVAEEPEAPPKDLDNELELNADAKATADQTESSSDAMATADKVELNADAKAITNQAEAAGDAKATADEPELTAETTATASQPDSTDESDATGGTGSEPSEDRPE
jgi:large subunit ribosomal protein L9